MHLFYYIPYLYTNKTRLGKNGRLISYFIILVIPPIYFALLQAKAPDLMNYFLVIMGVIVIQNNYEIGYIENDTETIKKESTPTIRLSHDDLSYYYAGKKKILLVRYFISILFAIALILIAGINEETIVFLSIACFLLFTFFIYNKIRGKFTLALHFILTCIKYTAVQFLFLHSFDLGVFVLSLFCYPIMNLIDRAATPRFFKRLSDIYIPGTHKYRMLYYSFLSLVCLFFYLFNLLSLASLGIVLYYFFYRFFIYINRIQ